MTDLSARAEIEVAVDPVTAFRAFTEEIDSWWIPGPINYFDSDRATGMRIEPGRGGRVLEVYRDGEVLVIARITAWEPGVRLTYSGVVDDSETDVTFEPAPSGTRVRVHQYLRPGGETAFLFWPNVVVWLVPWCAAHDGGRIPTEERMTND